MNSAASRTGHQQDGRAQPELVGALGGPLAPSPEIARAIAAALSTLAKRVEPKTSDNGWPKARRGWRFSGRDWPERAR